MVIINDFSKMRDHCKQTIESLEYWLRRLIDELLTGSYGVNYLDYVDNNGNNLINNQIRTRIQKRYKEKQTKFSRLIDAALLDDCIDIICNPVLFQKHFKEAFKNAFPDGNSRDETRTFLKRLVVPRNLLYHANPISVRQAEQVICYSHDAIESIKKYYQELNMVQEYNVPTIIKVTDSFGNEVHSTQFISIIQSQKICDLSEDCNSYLRPGDRLAIEVEVDSSFLADDYTITWSYYDRTKVINRKGKFIDIVIENKHVSESFSVNCEVTSRKDWHRFGSYDDLVAISYKVLPPSSR